MFHFSTTFLPQSMFSFLGSPQLCLEEIGGKKECEENVDAKLKYILRFLYACMCMWLGYRVTHMWNGSLSACGLGFIFVALVEEIIYLMTRFPFYSMYKYKNDYTHPVKFSEAREPQITLHCYLWQSCIFIEHFQNICYNFPALFASVFIQLFLIFITRPGILQFSELSSNR